MKKNFILIAAATVIGASAFLSGCSCAPQDPLSFSVSPANETLTYTVEYSADYIESYKKDESLNSLISLEYATGKYVSTCKKVDAEKRSAINSDIKDLLTDKDIYELTTEFSIDLTFNNEYHHKDTISTVAYIAPSGWSLAPLYAKESAEYLMIATDEETVATSVVKTESETFYNQDNYTKIKKYKVFNTDEEINFDDAKSEEYKGKYTFRTAIDNAELYFSLRGLTAIDEKSSKSFAVISPAYNEPTSITVQNNGKSTETAFTVKYNGTILTQDVPYVNLAFRLSNSNASGKPQYISIQTDKAGELANLNVPLKFAKPLYVSGTIKNLGCLVFTLSEIER